MKIVYIVFLLLILVGCSSTQVMIDTSPEKSQVFIKALGKDKLIPLGQAPIILSAKDLESKAQSSGPFVIEVKKDQYITRSVLLTEVAGVGDIKLNVRLDSLNEKNADGSLNDLIDRLFEIQRLAQVKRYDEALKKLDVIQNKNPKLSVVYELQGGIFFLKGQMKEAFDSYSMARKYNPSNPDLLQMIKRVEKKMKVGSKSAS